MRMAIAEASISGPDIPVGAVLVSQTGEVLSRSHNLKEATGDVTSHAEINVIRAGSALLGSWRLDGATLFSTLEPCAMCAAAISNSRIQRLVFGAWDERAGAAGSYLDLTRDSRIGPRVEVIGGVLKEECAAVLKRFFSDKR